MGVKTIKDVDDHTWREFKSLAARNNMKTGRFFDKLVEEYKNRSEDVWHKILHSGKILSDREAAELTSVVRKIRKEKGFRD